MKPALKITSVTVLMIFFYIGFGAIMYWQLTNLASLVEKLQTHPMAVTKGVLTASRDATAIGRTVRDMLLATDRKHRLALLSEIELYEKDMVQNINLVSERIAGTDGKVLLKKTIDLIDAEKALRQKLMDEVFAGNNERATELARTKGTALMTEIEETMDKIVGYAETQSMTYRIESINSLERANVILFSAGLIIAILSLVFGLVLGRSFLRGFKIAKNVIDDGAREPVDMTIRLHTPLANGINETINNFLLSADKKLSTLKSETEILLSASHARASRDAPSDQVELQVERIIKLLASLRESLQMAHPAYLQTNQLVQQVRADLIVINQIMSSDVFLVEMQSAGSLESDREYSKKLKNTFGALRSLLSKCAESLKEMSELHEPMLERFTHTGQLVDQQVLAVREINKFVEPLKIDAARLQELERGIEKIASLLKGFATQHDKRFMPEMQTH